MPKLTTSAAGYFEVDGLPFQKGSVRPLVQGDNVGLSLLGTPGQIVAPVPFGDWTNAADAAYGSVALLLVDFRTTLFQI